MKSEQFGALIISFVVAFTFSVPRAFACGPYFARAVFTYTAHPDFPLDSYVKGQLGVLEPEYARSYLVVAYRYMTGLGLNSDERSAVLALWDERLSSGYSYTDSGDRKSKLIDQSIDAWYKARNSIAGKESGPRVSVYRKISPEDYASYLNCNAYSFITATKTLENMINEYGVKSAEVKDWIKAQDQVFSNCKEGKNIPPPMDADGSMIVKANRDYQIASAYFYSGEYEQARKLFNEISIDTSSPWSGIANYLIARTYIRQATTSYNGEASKYLTAAETQLDNILKDEKLSELQASAKELQGLVKYKLYPEKRFHELAELMVRQNPGKLLKSNLSDYTWLFDRYMPDVDEEFWEEGEESRPLLKSDDDITDWIATFQTGGKEAFAHSIEKWSVLATEPWLVASLTKIAPGNPKVADLLKAAGSVKPGSPAYNDVMFHYYRLRAGSNENKDELRKELDAFLEGNKESLTPSALNLFLALRMKLAGSFEEFLKYAPRKPAGFVSDINKKELPIRPDGKGGLRDNEGEIFLWEDEQSEYGESLALIIQADPRLFDIDSTIIINRDLPLELIASMAEAEGLPANLRRDAAISAWVRAYMLGDNKIGDRVAPVLKELAPELKGFMDPYISAKSDLERDLSGLYIILKFPGMKPYVEGNIGRLTHLNQIDNFRDNWWCSFPKNGDVEDTELGGAYMNNELGWDYEENDAINVIYPAIEDIGAGFLDHSQKNSGGSEYEKLSSYETGPNYLSQRTVELAKAMPDDPRVPEMLHLAVKSTRYGCTDENTGKYSQAAFALLHNKYPNSVWAKKTSFWYD